MVDQLIDPQKVRADMDVMINMTTHPAFVDAMRTLKATPVGDRLDVGKKLLTVDALKAQGVDIPAGMRLTTRYFEPGSPDILQINPDGTVGNTIIPNANVPLVPGSGPLNPYAVGGCACGGGLTFCGGAGGSLN